MEIIGNGFIGSHLKEYCETNKVKEDIIYYCKGVMRTSNKDDFYKVNYEMLRDILENTKKKVVYLSSTQYNQDNDYGKSKRLGESLQVDYKNLIIYRLPNTFGANAKPNYNSVVATWLYNIKHDIPIIISNRETVLEIAYIDDVINCLVNKYRKNVNYIKPTYKIELGELADIIYGFKNEKKPVKVLQKKLYKTYRSY